MKRTSTVTVNISLTVGEEETRAIVRWQDARGVWQMFDLSGLALSEERYQELITNTVMMEIGDIAAHLEATLQDVPGNPYEDAPSDPEDASDDTIEEGGTSSGPGFRIQIKRVLENGGISYSGTDIGTISKVYQNGQFLLVKAKPINRGNAYGEKWGAPTTYYIFYTYPKSGSYGSQHLEGECLLESAPGSEWKSKVERL